MGSRLKMEVIRIALGTYSRGGATFRSIAALSNVSRSALSRWAKEENIAKVFSDKAMQQKVRTQIDFNLAQRASRGGKATRGKKK